MKKKVLSVFLVLAMVLSVLPMSVFAAENESITYIDRSWNGEKIVETEKECTDYVVVDDTISAFEDGGWYVATGDVTNEKRIKTNGTVNLILCDGCTLNATSGIIVNEGDALNVYCQSDDSGILIAKASKFDAGIGSDQRINSGIISIYGGSVDATGGYCSAAIGGGMNGSGAINIYGGTVNADNSMGETNAFAAAIGGSTLADDTVVTIYGGTVTATGKHGAGIGGAYYQKGTVTINGGNVTATSEVGAGIGCGRLGNGGKITINGGVVVASSDYGAGIGGGSGSEIEINSGIVTATSVNSAGIGGDYDATDHGTLTVAENAVIKAGDSEPGTEVTADEYIQNRNKYVNITFPELLEPVKYIDRSWDGEKVAETEKECSDYIIVDANTTAFEDGNWFVVSGEVTISGRIVVSGTANLILCDGCTLNANSGIQLFEGNALNIYGQSADSGKLNAKASYLGNSGIGGNQNNGNGGDLTVYGGSVYASGQYNAAGIGGGWLTSGGSFTMYGGFVESKGQNAAGIGKGFKGSDGNFTVYGTPQVYAGDTAPDIETTVAGYESSRNSYVKIIYSNHVHTWLDATCTEPKTCSECGEKIGSPLGHTWVKGDMVSEATCTQPAVYRYECSRCHETKNDEFGEKAAHHFVNNVCTECGTNVFVIDESGCLTGYNGIGGDVVIPEGVNSIGESAFGCCLSLTEVTIPESVTAIGDYAFEVCMNLMTVTITDNIKSVGEDVFVGASITTVNYPCGDDLDTIKAYFGGADLSDTTYNAFHVYSAQGTLVSEATCTQPAVYTAKCKGCDLVQGTMDVGEALGHTWQDATCTTPKTCSVCKKTEGEALGHTWQDATCTTPKTCSVCDITEGEALGHAYELNSKGKAKCKRCSDVLPAPKDSENLNSSAINVGDIIKSGTVITPDDNRSESYMGVFVDGKDVGVYTPYKKYTAPTCLKCVSKSTVDRYGNYEIYFETACPYSEATCTEPSTCLYCGHTKGEPLGHAYENGICTVCGFEPENVQSYIDRTWDGEKVVETEKKCAVYIVVDANTTTFENGKWYVVNGEVTVSGRIVVSGTANLILCDGCTLNANSGIQLFEGNALNIYGQSADSGKLNAKASYLGNSGIGGNQNNGNGGSLTVYGGSVYASGQYNAAGIGGGWLTSGGSFTMYGGFVESQGQNATGIGKGFKGSDGSFTVYGTPHVYAGDTAPDIETTVAGYESSRNSYVKIIYSNHVHTWLDATCTEPQTCSECGEKIGSPLGHTWVKGDMVSEATCTQPAVYRYECSRCHETKNEEFGEKAAHHFVNNVCTECGDEFLIDERGCLTGYNGSGGDVVIPEGVTSIGDGAFFACTGLTKVTIPESVTSIGDNAFGGCLELRTVTVSDNIKSVGEHAFSPFIRTVNYPCDDDLDIIKAYFDNAVSSGTTYNAVHVYSGSFKDNNDGTHSQKCRGCSEYNEPQAHTFENGVCTECGYTPFAFDSVSLVLSGELGLNFYTVINDVEAVKDGYMLFEIGNKVETQAVYFTDAVLVDGRYVFRCNVNALQMADAITVSFHYGDVTVGPKTTSVASYIDKLIAKHNNDDTDPTVKLAKSILNYGHYAQLAQTETRNIKLGEDYAVTDNLSDVTIANASDLEAYKATKTGSIDGITKVSRSLSLDHGTDINLYLTVKDEYVPNVTVADKNGNAVDFTLEKTGSRYMLVIPQIAAHQLGDTYTVSVDDGAMTVKVSALSYAYSVLSSEKTDAQKLCVSALYEYYTAAITYRNAQ